MSIISILRDANNFSRRKFSFKFGGLKSPNKIYIDQSKLSGKKRELYSMEAIILKNGLLGDFRRSTSSDSSERKYQKIESSPYPVGNCYEYSLVAFFYLQQQRNQDVLNEFKSSCTIEIIGTYPPYSHNFVLIVPDQGSITRNIGDTFIRNQLPANSWICDPWANIVCEAKFYSIEWRLKMEKWSNNKKHILGVLDANGVPMDHADPRDDSMYYLAEKSITKIVDLIKLEYEKEERLNNIGELLMSLDKDDMLP
ncbi:hypothetical protein [Xenorhabdus bharatensis]|uniref:hypothetical protein n=1 Tax=Xenorhabdus bharatensis TaxID=3136256 RepID=UPI0030F42A05